ncbi:hypothetical protein [Nannocystis pusilla]|uniref:hypothetical protein n=1 Tax=Nannocystis pusilla TaxID=889268 RepID=UPI003B7BD1D1
MPVSGRPAGEVTGLCRYLPGVTRGLAENGLLEVIPDRAPRWLGRPTDKPRLRQVGERLNAEHDARLRLTGDDFCRLGDIAYERDGRDEPELVRLRDLAAEMGVHLVWSNVHVHLAESVPDKGAAVLQMAAELGLDPRAIVTIGDAPNDAGLFVGGRFGATVGTADIAGQCSTCPRPCIHHPGPRGRRLRRDGRGRPRGRGRRGVRAPTREKSPVRETRRWLRRSQAFAARSTERGSAATIRGDLAAFVLCRGA